MNKNPQNRKSNLVIQEFEGETLIYDLNENKAFCLNETASVIWQLCDGEKNVTEISQMLEQKLNSRVTEDLVFLALDQLKEQKLIENCDDLPNHFVGMSRREAIRRVGLGTVVALPIVASMAAPTSVQAGASCLSCTCSTMGAAMADDPCNTAGGPFGGVACMIAACVVCRSSADKANGVTGPGYCTA